MLEVWPIRSCPDQTEILLGVHSNEVTTPLARSDKGAASAQFV